MDPELIVSGGLPVVLLVGLGVVWREWQADRKRAETRYAEALNESREDAKAMHELATNLGKATDAIANINANGIKLDGVSKKLDEIIKHLVERPQ